MRIILSMLLMLALAATTGCSFSKSSGSISDSISSPSKSSSESSSGDDDDEKAPEPEAPAETASYEADVSQLAVTYAKSGGEIGAFRSAVSQLAKPTRRSAAGSEQPGCKKSLSRTSRRISTGTTSIN